MPKGLGKPVLFKDPSGAWQQLLVHNSVYSVHCARTEAIKFSCRSRVSPKAEKPRRQVKANNDYVMMII